MHLNDIDRDGLLVVCRLGDPKCEAAAKALMRPDSPRTQLTLSREIFGRTTAPVTFELTAIRPRAD